MLAHAGVRTQHADDDETLVLVCRWLRAHADVGSGLLEGFPGVQVIVAMKVKSVGVIVRHARSHVDFHWRHWSAGGMLKTTPKAIGTPRRMFSLAVAVEGDAGDDQAVP